MQRTSLADFHCSVARTVDIIGEWWTPLILRDAFYGRTRFEDFQRSLGVARNVLTVRLERMVETGIMERRRYQERPPRDEYVLTDKGRDLFPVIAALLAWGDRWTAGRPGLRCSSSTSRAASPATSRRHATSAGSGWASTDIQPAAARRGRAPRRADARLDRSLPAPDRIVV